MDLADALLANDADQLPRLLGDEEVQSHDPLRFVAGTLSHFTAHPEFGDVFLVELQIESPNSLRQAVRGEVDEELLGIRIVAIHDDWPPYPFTGMVVRSLCE